MSLGRGSQMTSYLKFYAPKRVAVDEKSSEREGQTVYVTSGCMNFYVGSRDREYWVHVPHGWRLTGAVLPKFFRSWIKPDSIHGKAALIHHYLCTTGRVKIAKVRMTVDRYEANMVFLEAMKVAGVGFLKRWILLGAAFLALERVDSDEDEPDQAFSS
mgnify:CR=1 FL=1